MTRATRIRVTVALALIAGCGSLGKETLFPFPVTTSGVGPFRALAEEETGISGVDGEAILLRNLAVDSAMRIGDALFYAVGEVPAEIPERDDGVPAYDIDWGQFGPREIRRAARRPELEGFDGGPTVLTASEAWEGGYVTDPWVVALPDGRARLYYAAAGGVGVAEASGVDGTFSRVGSAPVIATDASLGDGSAPRSPSVVDAPDGDGFLMYFDAGDGVQWASSGDGLSWTIEDGQEGEGGATDPLPLRIPPLDPGDPAFDPDADVEVALRMPGAAVAVTPGKTTLVRVYFEVLLSDGSTMVSMAASEDGRSFERFEGVSFAGESSGAPRPMVDGAGVTRLFATVDRNQRRQQTHALVVAVTPSLTRFADPPEDE